MPPPRWTCRCASLTTDAGVDIVSFGGTKNGLLGGEAVVFLSSELADGFEYLRKQSLQLASKMRFVAAQFTALLSNDLWLRNARHANAMAARLADAVADVPGLKITRPVQTNVVFASLPADAIADLRRQFMFYVWDESRDEVRWMCSWDTTEDGCGHVRRSGAGRDGVTTGAGPAHPPSSAWPSAGWRSSTTKRGRRTRAPRSTR